MRLPFFCTSVVMFVKLYLSQYTIKASRKMTTLKFGPQLGSMYHQGKGANVIDMPYSELKKKFDVTTTGISGEFMSNYQRSVLADRRAEPKAFDYEEPSKMGHYSRSVLQHRYGGMRQGRNPDMPEINTEMRDFDPRGTSTDPDMSKLVADTWAREYHLRRLPMPDKSEDFHIDAPISQWEAGPLKKAIFHNVKNRTIMFDTSWDNYQYGIKPADYQRSMVNVTLADDTGYGELAKMVDGQVVNRTGDISRVAPSNTGLMHQTTTDRKLPVGSYGDVRSGVGPGPTSINHMNFQYQSGMTNTIAGKDAFQSRATAKMYIDNVLRNLDFDGNMRDGSTDTQTRSRAKELSDVLAALHTNAAGVGIGEAKKGESRDTMTSARPNQENRAKLINMITEDANIRKLYVESFNSSAPALREFNSLVRMVLNDKPVAKRSEDMVNRGAINHTMPGAKSIQHLGQRTDSIYGKREQMATHVYTGSELPQHLGARKSMYASDPNIVDKEGKLTAMFRSANPKLINNFLDNPDTDFSATDYGFNKGAVQASAKPRHAKRYVDSDGAINGSNGRNSSDSFGDSIGDRKHYGDRGGQRESMTYRR